MTGSPGPTTDQEALREEFLGALGALGGSAGDGRLRELLGWEEGPCEAVKASLLATGRLRPGRGRGGSVSLAGSPGAAAAAEIAMEAGGASAEAEGSQARSFAAPPGAPNPAASRTFRTEELRESQGLDPEPFLLRVAGQAFCHTSALSLKRLMGDQDNIGESCAATSRPSRRRCATSSRASSSICNLIGWTRPGCCTW